MPLYPVSVRKLWLIVSRLKPTMSRAECMKQIEILTSPSAAPLYYRAMKAWGLLFEAGGRVELRQLSSYSELARIVYERILEDMGRELLSVLKELERNAIAPHPELVWRRLRSLGRDVSLWKVSVALRLLRACGVLCRAVTVEEPPENDTHLILRIVKGRGALTVGKLRRIAERLYGLSAERVDQGLLRLVIEERVNVSVPSQALLSLAVARKKLPFRLRGSEVPDALRAELTRLEELGLVRRVNGELEVLRPWDDESLVWA